MIMTMTTTRDRAVLAAFVVLLTALAVAAWHGNVAVAAIFGVALLGTGVLADHLERGALTASETEEQEREQP